MADPRTPPTPPLGSPPHVTPAQTPPYPTNTTTTHIRETKPTNWFVYLLGGAVVVVGIAALVLSGDDAPVTQPAGGNNVTIESAPTATDGGPVSPMPDATAPDATAPATPDAGAPATTPDAAAPTDAPAAVDPVTPAPDATAPDAAAPAPAN